MIIAITGAGVFLTVLSRFIQMRRFIRMWRETFVRTFRGDGAGEGDICPFPKCRGAAQNPRSWRYYS